MKQIKRSGLLVAVLLGETVLAGDPAVLRVGLARTEITPTQPVEMAGYASRKELSRGVHDPLSARAVAFEYGSGRLVLVNTEVLGFYGGTCAIFREAILRECRLEPEELLLTAIHTHAAPTLALDPARTHANNVAYTRALQDQLVQLTKQSLAGLRPATLTAASGASPVGVNRRERVTTRSGKIEVRLGRNPSIPTDREVQVLVVRFPGRPAPAGILFAYPTHSTSLGPGNHQISGDVHGLAAQFVERYYGPETIAPAFAGASGDIDPWFRVVPGFKHENGWVPEPVLLGTLLGEEVVQVVEGAGSGDLGGPIQSRLKVLKLPGKAGAPGETGPTSESVELVVSVARVGEVAIVGLGGEVFNEIGRTIKAASPFPHTLVITHCNGAAGYLPVKAAYAEGGYEVRTSPFAPEAAGLVLTEVSGLLRELHGSAASVETTSR